MQIRGFKRFLSLASVSGLIVMLAAPAAISQFKDAPTGGFPPPKGQIAFIRDKDLWVMNADGSGAKELLVSGRIANKLAWSPDNQELMYCQQGQQTYELPAGGGGAAKLYDILATRVENPKTSLRQLTNDAQSNFPTYFPKGDLIAFTVNLNSFSIFEPKPNYQVFVGGPFGNPSAKNLNKGKATSALQLMAPAVSPDGSQIACIVTDENRAGTANFSIGVALFPATGFTGTPEEWIAKAQAIPHAYGPAWSPDGRFIAYVDGSTTPRSLAIWDVQRKAKTTLHTPQAQNAVDTTAPSWSPDGNWIVFSNGQNSIMIVDRNGKNLKPLTAQGTDSCPAFSN